MDISESLKKKAGESDELKASIPQVMGKSSLEKGMAEEGAEHPTLGPAIIEVIVKDHLAKDPAYYDGETEEVEEEEEDGEEE